AKPIEALRSRHPDVAFAVFEKAGDRVAGEAAVGPEPVNACTDDSVDALVARADPDRLLAIDVERRDLFGVEGRDRHCRRSAAHHADDPDAITRHGGPDCSIAQGHDAHDPADAIEPGQSIAKVAL